MFNPWLLTFQTMQLGMEAQSVIALRMMRFAAGGVAAPIEAQRMIADKIAAGIEAQAAMAASMVSGHSEAVAAGKVLRVYKKRVRANRRRLSRR